MQDRVKMNAKVTIHYNTQAQDVYGDDPDKPFQYVPTHTYTERTCIYSITETQRDRRDYTRV
jgi:hypothetical protein